MEGHILNEFPALLVGLGFQVAKPDFSSLKIFWGEFFRRYTPTITSQKGWVKPFLRVSLPDIANQKPGFSLPKALELAWSARQTTILACSDDKKPGFSVRVG